jgi:hypothetical protein
MQTSTNNTNGFHVKVATQKETRRFFFEGKYEALANYICQIFGLSKDSVVIKYSDDEGDFVTISSDEELDFARQLAVTGLLRLVVSENTPQRAFCHKNAGRRHCPVQPSNDRECATENPWREKWLKKQEMLSQDPEWVQQRISKLTSKLQCMQSRLAKFENCESGPQSHKFVQHREKFQQKINFITKQLEKLNEKAARADFVPLNAGTQVPAPEQLSLASKEEAFRALDELHSVIPSLRFAHRQANLQLQLRRTDVQSAYHQFQNGDTSITKEKIDELKTLLRQAKEVEQAKKTELKAHMQKVHATRQSMKAFKKEYSMKNRNCDKSSPCHEQNKTERKAMKAMWRQQRAAYKAAKREEQGAPVSCPPSFDKC